MKQHESMISEQRNEVRRIIYDVCLELAKYQ